MRTLIIFSAFIALSVADVFDSRDLKRTFGTISQSEANKGLNTYYLDNSGKDEAPNCGNSANDLPCKTYAGIKAQFVFPEPIAPVVPNPTDYEDDQKYKDDFTTYEKDLKIYNRYKGQYFDAVTINIGSKTNQVFSDTFVIDEHKYISIKIKPEDPNYLVLADKLNPALPIFDVKSGSLTITDLQIEHYESDTASEKGIINFVSEIDDVILYPALSITRVTFRQRDWKATQTRPYITFISETASFELSNSRFEKAKISAEGLTVKNAVGFTFRTNKFTDISGTTGTENLVHLVDVKQVKTERSLIIAECEFINIGKNGPVNDVLFVEQTGEQQPYSTNEYTLNLNANKFVGNNAQKSGGLDFITNGYDLIVYRNIFFDNAGVQASDILVSGDHLSCFEYQFDGTRSTPTYLDRVSVKIDKEDLSSTILNSETTFTVIENSASNSYLTIGEALYKAKLGNLDEEIIVQLIPGKYTRDGLNSDSLTIGNSVSSNGPTIYYPQKVAIVGNGDEKPMIVRINSNSFKLTVENEGELRLNNLHFMNKDGEVISSALVDFRGKKLTIDDVEFVDNNNPGYNLINLESFADVSITNSVFRNNIATNLISAAVSSTNAKLRIYGNKFTNDEFLSSYTIANSALYISSTYTGDVKITDNTFKNLKVGTNSAPVYIQGQSSTVKIEHNTFEDNTGGAARAVILSSIGLGRIEDILFSNKIIKSSDKDLYKAVYLVDGEDYSYLIPEYINRRYVVKGQAPTGNIPEEVFASLPDAIGGIIGSSTAKLFINIIGGTEGHEASTVNKPLLSLEIVGVDHIEDKLARKDDQPQFMYEEVLGVQLNQSGSFIVGTYRSLDLRNLNITYKGPKTDFLIDAKEGAILTVKNAVIDVPKPEKSDKEDTDGYVGYIKLEGKNVASFTNVKFGAMLLKNPLGEFSTGAAIVGRNVVGLALIDTVFTDVVINNESLAVSAIRVGTSPTSSVVSISNSIFEQADVKKNNKDNKNPFDKEFKTPAVYLWTELRDDGTKGTSGTLSINNTKFTHCRGGAIRIRDIDAKIGASTRFAENLPRFKNFKTFEANIQIEGASIIEAEEESFVKEGTKDKNSYSWILPSGDKATFSGSIAKNSGARLFTLPVLSKASGKYDTSVSGAIVTLNGKRLYPLGDLKVEIFEEGKEEAIALGVRQLYVNEKYTHKESKLYYTFPLDVEEDKNKSWRVRLIYGLGKRTADVQLKIK